MFDPDEFLAEEETFEPDSYIEDMSEEDKTLALGQGPIRMPEEEVEAFDPDSFLEEPEPTTSGFEAGLGGITKGATMGLGDELYGGIKAGLGTIGIGEDQSSVFDEGPLDRLKSRYQAGRDERRAYDELLQKEHPKTFKGGEIGGAIASTVVAPGKSVFKRAAGEGALFGFGESEAEMSGIIDLDMDEMEIKEALKDTGIGAGIGVATAGLVKGGGKLAKTGYQKMFGKSTRDMAKDAAGDILSLTPKQRADAAGDIVKTGPGKTSNVLEELPEFMKRKGGISQNIKTLKNETAKALDDTGKKIGDVLEEYDTLINPATVTDKAKVAGREFLRDSNKLNFADVAGEIFDDLKLGQKADVIGYEGQVEKALSYLQKLESKGTMESIKDIHSYRKEVDKLIKSFQGIGKTSASDALYQDALMKTRRKLSNHIQEKMLSGNEALAAMRKNNIFPSSDINKLRRMQNEIYIANRDYKLATFVNDQIETAVGKKDFRKLFGLTDWLVAVQGLHSPVLTAAGLTAKKTGEHWRPRLQLHAEELTKGMTGKVLKAGDTAVKGLGKGVETLGGVGRPAIIQQATQQAVTQKPIEEKVQGTKYQQLFEGLNDHQKAVRNSLLHQTDQNYRMLGKEEEE